MALVKPASTSFSISFQVGVTSSESSTSSFFLPFSALTACSCWGTWPAGVSTCKLIWHASVLGLFGQSGGQAALAEEVWEP